MIFIFFTSPTSQNLLGGTGVVLAHLAIEVAALLSQILGRLAVAAAVGQCRLEGRSESLAGLRINTPFSPTCSKQ